MTFKILASTFVAAVGICIALPVSATPHCRACPYSCADVGLGKKDCSDIARGATGVCCVDLSSKGLTLAQEQDRVLAQNSTTTTARNNAAHDHCPPGFSPSEQKCSNEERRRGCKDMRLPSGLGCVHR